MARAILKGLPLVQSRRRSPMLIVATDNFPIPNQKNTNMDDVYTFLRYFIVIYICIFTLDTYLTNNMTTP